MISKKPWNGDAKGQKGAHARGADRLITLHDLTIEKRTDKALLVNVAGNPVWVPKSQIRDVDEAQGDGKVTMVVTEWIAKEKGLL